jgi:hypothetical protein
MDLRKAIEDLSRERKRLDSAIAALEEIERRGEGRALSQPAKRRGRKYMKPEERKKVSERMKSYWKRWRETVSLDPPQAERG